MSESHQLAGAPTTVGPYTPGTFVWHEYVSHDTAGAQTFYAELFGWTIKSKSTGEEPEYPEIHVGDKPIGGFFQCDAGADERPAFWFGYVSVGDVDKATELASAAGGRVLVGPKDIPNVGRFATIADPQGGVFAAFHGLHGDPPEDTIPGAGEFCWDSLGTTDVAAAEKFYPQIVGWRPGADMTGTGAVFFMGAKMEASYGPAPAGVPAHWLAHVLVPNLAEARAKVEQLGGKILMSQIETIYGTYDVIQDPFRAVLALFEGHDQGREPVEEPDGEPDEESDD